MLLHARAGSLPSSSWGWVRPAPRPFNSLYATWAGRQTHSREYADQATQRPRWGSGKAGRELFREAVRRGDVPTAIVRDAERAEGVLGDYGNSAAPLRAATSVARQV
ncbi:MAG: hypothetical protein IPL36_13240 [Nigerium sp.]|nr:hypothetical protein [Nigerium sp.]